MIPRAVTSQFKVLHIVLNRPSENHFEKSPKEIDVLHTLNIYMRINYYKIHLCL